MRWALAEPLYISSGYRCADYNTTVSTTGPVGPHVQGLAADIRCFGGKAHRVLSAALSFGVPRIGVSQKGSASGRFLHVDLLESELSPWIWSY